MAFSVQNVCRIAGLLGLWLISPFGLAASPNRVEQSLDFDVVIAGGSTAAFAAAIASASSGAKTALLEPTDWVGGQLTSSGVPAVDEAWHSIKNASGEVALNVAKIARTPANITPNFLAALRAVDEPGDCWVSRYCFQPDRFRQQQLLPLQTAAGDNLQVFLNTVVKQVKVANNQSRLQGLTAIRRTPRPGVAAGGYDRLPSQDLADWYSPESSPRFDKETLSITGKVFIDATEWGELLALTDAPYLQGVDETDGALTGDDACGQSIVFCFVQELNDEETSPAEETSSSKENSFGYGDYTGRDDAWQKIWTYRRIRGRGPPAVGDLCLQNWGYSGKQGQGGNDYPFGYLFKTKQATRQERNDWQGGVDLAVMAAAEQRALGWHQWFSDNAPANLLAAESSTGKPTMRLAGEVLGTGHGLAKLPYIRDTRRSIGIDHFLLRYDSLVGDLGQSTGQSFPDRVALGAYPMDVHPLTDRDYPDYIAAAKHDTLPFYIPFRSLTNQQVDNLLVAGKTMAQTFLANSATRLHPIEWSTGTAAGVSAAYMARTGKTSREAYQSISELQPLIAEQTPIDWKLPPPPTEPR